MKECGNLLLAASTATDRPIVIYNDRRRIVYVNRAFTSMLGYNPEEVIGQKPAGLISKRSLSDQQVRRLIYLPWGRERIYEKMRVQHKDGTELWIWISSSPFSEDENSPYFRFSVDVLYDLSQEQQLRDLEHDILDALTSDLSFDNFGDHLCRRIQMIIPESQISLCRVANRRLKPWAAPNFPSIYNSSMDGAEIGEGAASCGTAAYRGEPVMVHDIETDPLWAPYKQVLADTGLRACWSFPIKRQNGAVVGTFAFYFKDKIANAPVLERIATSCVHLCLLAIEREDRHKQLSNLTQFNSLTGLPNLNYLDNAIDDFMDGGICNDLILLHVDIDRLIDINTVFGLKTGDSVILMMTTRLKEICEDDHIFCHLSGDEFAVLVPDGDIHHAAVLADRLVEAAQSPFNVDEKDLRLSVSIGISQCSGPIDAKTKDLLLVNAKSATQRAKNLGGNCYQFFNSDANESARDRVLLGSALRRALDRDGLHLHYQPQLHINGQLYGVEALARWHDEEFGDISPKHFIALAEEIGLIEKIGHWVLREACRQMAAWREIGAYVPAISVNLSVINLGNPCLPQYISSLLSEFGLPGGSLTIEITESVALNLTEKMLQTMQSLRNIGVGFSIDDFGTGYSSLANLMNLPIKEVKLDRSFIRKAATEHRYRSIITAVIDIGQALDLNIVAEGVETQEEMDLLCAEDGIVIQGYYYMPPLGATELGIWIGERQAQAAPQSQ